MKRTMTEKWEKIIDALSVVKPECVNRDKIKQMMQYDYTVDEQVLDNLYLLGVLTLDEYKERIASRIQHMKGVLKFAEDRLQQANEKVEKFNPLIYYACCGPYRGAVIETEINTEFIKKRGGI